MENEGWIEQTNRREIQEYEALLEDDKLPDDMRKQLEKWVKMLKGDAEALIEIMIERGMATKEDFPHGAD